MLEGNRTTATVEKAASEPKSVYESAVSQLRAAADRLGVAEGVYLLLSRPKRELTVHFPVEMDNGEER